MGPKAVWQRDMCDGGWRGYGGFADVDRKFLVNQLITIGVEDISAFVLVGRFTHSYPCPLDLWAYWYFISTVIFRCDGVYAHGSTHEYISSRLPNASASRHNGTKSESNKSVCASLCDINMTPHVHTLMRFLLG